MYGCASLLSHCLPSAFFHGTYSHCNYMMPKLGNINNTPEPAHIVDSGPPRHMAADSPNPLRGRLSRRSRVQQPQTHESMPRQPSLVRDLHALRLLALPLRWTPSPDQAPLRVSANPPSQPGARRDGALPDDDDDSAV
ncbi:uncharacterized protein BJX67DRAFT_332255 [Aspergillus lucknowensis]|uniref:Uncharacterized protein n=1 Tax=Aspergillus lucknowensis TaxID=176173 RepID=A0ABR4LY53_9EURO